MLFIEPYLLLFIVEQCSLFNFFLKLLDQRCWRFSEGYPNNFSTKLSSQIFDCCPRNFLIQEKQNGNVVSTSHWIWPVQKQCIFVWLAHNLVWLRGKSYSLRRRNSKWKTLTTSIFKLLYVIKHNFQGCASHSDLIFSANCPVRAIDFTYGFMSWQQECIPVGCAPSAAVAVSLGEGGCSLGGPAAGGRGSGCLSHGGGICSGRWYPRMHWGRPPPLWTVIIIII